MGTLKRIVCFSSLSIVFIVIAYFFIDRQVVWFLAAHDSRQLLFLKAMAEWPVNVLYVLLLLFYPYFLCRMLCTHVSELEQKLLCLANAMVLAVFLKNMLKLVFGRYWPATFSCNNLSLLKNHAYGFAWFQQNSSFPSGHTALIIAFATGIWMLWSKLRWLGVLLGACVIVGQVGNYYHFVSDVIAGALLGYLTAFGTLYYCKRA